MINAGRRAILHSCLSSRSSEMHRLFVGGSSTTSPPMYVASHSCLPPPPLCFNSEPLAPPSNMSPFPTSRFVPAFEGFLHHCTTDGSLIRKVPCTLREQDKMSVNERDHKHTSTEHSFSCPCQHGEHSYLRSVYYLLGCPWTSAEALRLQMLKGPKRFFKFRMSSTLQ